MIADTIYLFHRVRPTSYVLPINDERLFKRKEINVYNVTMHLIVLPCCNTLGECTKSAQLNRINILYIFTPLL